LKGVFAAGVAAGLAFATLAWIAAGFWQHAFGAKPQDVQVVATFSREPPASDAPAARAAVPTVSVTPPVAEAAPAPRTPEAGRYAKDYPVYQKLVSQPLSAEPHQLLGAWDEDPDAKVPGERRAFVLAVSPGQSDQSLEALARDVRERNLDARLLDVRIYDDAGAALGPRLADGGTRARQHLVAVVERNPAAAVDTIRVRGRTLEP
jgi:hypothetical protein